MSVAGSEARSTPTWNAADHMSVEQLFETREVPSWGEQLTFRAFVVSFAIGVFQCLIVMKLNLTAGIIPSLNVSAGLLGFFFVKMWTTVAKKVGLLARPFTRQENTVIQTCVVACSGIAFSGGFGSYLLGMSKRIASELSEADDKMNTKELRLSWIIFFLLIISFVGLFSVGPLRQSCIELLVQRLL